MLAIISKHIISCSSVVFSCIPVVHMFPKLDIKVLIHNNNKKKDIDNSTIKLFRTFILLIILNFKHKYIMKKKIKSINMPPSAAGCRISVRLAFQFKLVKTFLYQNRYNVNNTKNIKFLFIEKLNALNRSIPILLFPYWNIKYINNTVIAYTERVVNEIIFNLPQNVSSFL